MMDPEKKKEFSKGLPPGRIASSLGKQSSSSDEDQVHILVNRHLPKIKHYIVRRMNMAHSIGALPKQVLRTKEILHTVYINLFEALSAKQQKEQPEILMYQVVDQTLRKELAEIEFESSHFLALQNLENNEVRNLKEKFTVDAEGELIMMEELDDVSYQQGWYPFQSLFLEDHDAVSGLEKVMMENDKKFIHQEIRKQLLKLPEKERTIFDLFWLASLELEQIAKIRHIKVQEAEKILTKVTLKVKQGLEEKFKKK